MKSIPSSNEQVICLSTAQVRRTLKRVNPYKVARPDNIPGQMLKECAEQLADTLTDVLKPLWARQSFQHVSRPPQSFQYQKISPVPKKPLNNLMNNYCPVALILVIMKWFGRLVMSHIKVCLPRSSDPIQFAYHPNWSTDVAMSAALHLSLIQLTRRILLQGCYSLTSPQPLTLSSDRDWLWNWLGWVWMPPTTTGS